MVAFPLTLALVRVTFNMLYWRLPRLRSGKQECLRGRFLLPKRVAFWARRNPEGRSNSEEIGPHFLPLVMWTIGFWLPSGVTEESEAPALRTTRIARIVITRVRKGGERGPAAGKRETVVAKKADMVSKGGSHG